MKKKLSAIDSNFLSSNDRSIDEINKFLSSITPFTLAKSAGMRKGVSRSLGLLDQSVVQKNLDAICIILRSPINFVERNNLKLNCVLFA